MILSTAFRLNRRKNNLNSCSATNSTGFTKPGSDAWKVMLCLPPHTESPLTNTSDKLFTQADRDRKRGTDVN